MKTLLFILLCFGKIGSAYATGQNLWCETYTYTQLQSIVEKTTPDVVTQRFELDLNKDGLRDRFLGVTCGNGGCDYHLFIQVSKRRYKYKGSISLHKLGFEVLESNHNSLPDILSYWRTSAGTGILSRYQFDGRKYVETGRYEGRTDLFNLLNVTPIDEVP